MLVFFFMETLEEEAFVLIMVFFKWFLYVDDILVLPENLTLDNKLRMYRHSGWQCKVFREQKAHQQGLFIHTVFAKTQCKDELRTFIGFYLRAVRIQRDEFFESEMADISEAFRKLM